MKGRKFLSAIALAQGIYYILTGMWPIFSRKTFVMITGPKVDFWLVRTTGALIAVIGAGLTLAGVRGRVSEEAALLGIGSAASLCGSDFIYSSRGRISPVYAAEGFVEGGLVGLWLAGLLVNLRRQNHSVLQFPPGDATTHRI